MAGQSQDYGTVIGPDANFKGEFTFESAAKVLGSIEGAIRSKGAVYVAEGSNCKATVTAKEISVEGMVEGNVEASDRLDIKSTGRIQGDVVASKMSMAEGASIDGYCRIGTNGKASAAGGGGTSDGAKETTRTEVKPNSSGKQAETATASSKK